MRTDIPVTGEAESARVSDGARDPEELDKSASYEAVAFVEKALKGMGADEGGPEVADRQGRDSEGVAGDIGTPPARSRTQDDFDFDDDEPAGGEPASPRREGRRPAEDNAKRADPLEGIDEGLIEAAAGVDWDRKKIAGHVEKVGKEQAIKDLESIRSGVLQEFDFIHQPQRASVGGGFLGPQSPQVGQFQGQPPPGVPGQAAGPPFAQAAGTQVPATQQGPSQQPLQLPQPFTDEQVERLRDQYGDDVVDQEILPQREQLVRAAQAAYQAQASQEQAEAQRLTGEINSFFDGTAGRGYADVYGKSMDSAAIKQQYARNEVLTLACGIARAYRDMGRSISLSAALARAHAGYNRERIAADGQRQVEANVIRRHRQTSIPPGSPGSGRAGAKDIDSDAKEAIRALHAKHNIPVPVD